MAKRHLEQYDKNGNLLDIYLNDDEVMVDGQTLADKLSDMEEDIEDAGSGDGTVTGVKVGTTPYNPDRNGVVDLSVPFNGKVDKETGKSLMTDAERTKLQNLPTSDQLTTQLGQKANDADVVKGVSVNGTAQTKDGNGNVNINVQTGGQVTVTTNNDGTFTIHSGENDYTINLNHTHEGMVKLEKVTEATLPQTMADDTIYVQVDNLTTPQEIEALYIFGIEFAGGGGFAPGTPHLTSPSQTQISSGIDIGNTSGGVATYPLKIKAKDITQPLVVEWGSGSTGYSFDTTDSTTASYYDSNTGKLTIPVADATNINGVFIVIKYSGSAYDAEGTLGISSSSADGINVEVPLIANRAIYEDVNGARFTGTQWLQTDYYPNANTEFDLELKFTANSNTETVNDSIGRHILACAANSNPSKYFSLYNLKPTSSNTNNAYGFEFLSEDDVGGQAMSYQSGTSPIPSKSFLTADHSVIRYRTGSTNYSYSFDSGGTGVNVVSCPIEKKNSTMANPLRIAGHPTAQYARFTLDIYRLTIKENGVIVRDYVPKTYMGKIGLLDVSENGTGLFLTSETAKTSGLAADELTETPSNI